MAGVYAPCIGFKIGDSTFEGPNDLISIDHIRLAGGASESVVIEIYDSMGLDVEQAILTSNTEEFEFWYGYSGGVISPRYKATLTNLAEVFEGTSLIITIEGVPTGVVKATTSSSTAKYYMGRASDIVAQIAAEEGWIIKTLVETTDIDLKCYRRKGQSAEEFIDTVVIPYAISIEGKRQYQLCLESLSTGTSMYFFPKGYIVSEDTYDFIIGESSEEVMGWYPETSSILTGVVGSSGYVVNTVSATANENTVTTVTNRDGNGYQKAGLLSSTVDTVSDAAKIQNKVELLNSLSWTATLMLKGKPNIQAGSNIRVRCFTRSGSIHFSSGEYLIASVEDLIQDGVFTTELVLYAGAQANLDVETTTTLRESSGDSSFYQKGSSLGMFTITAYCSCKKCCGKYSPEVTGRPSKTKSGTTPVQGRTIAVDPKVIPLGTKVIFNDHTYTAEDVGGAIKGNHIDLYFSNHSDAVAWGRKTMEVFKASEVSVSGSVSVPSGVPDNYVSRACQNYLGLPYQWGGKGPNSYDCSGFACALINQLGGHISGGTATLVSVGTSVGSLDQAKPGDLVVRRSGSSGHVQVYVGNGWVCHAPQTGDVIKFSKVMSNYTSIRRVL